MRRNRVVPTVLLVGALIHLTGCDYYNSSHSGQQWEHAAMKYNAQAGPVNRGYMSATDGLGGVVFAGPVVRDEPRTVITGVPTE